MSEIKIPKKKNEQQLPSSLDDRLRLIDCVKFQFLTITHLYEETDNCYHKG